jgi:hypothetical protein
MIISSTIWLASLIFIGIIFVGKKRELKDGEPLVHIGSSVLDKKILDFYNQKHAWLKQVDWKYITTHLHYWAEHIEKAGLLLAEKLVYKFSQARDVATGKDLQKNKGHIALKGFLKKFTE